MEMLKDETFKHDCMKLLCSVVYQQLIQVTELEKTLVDHKQQLAELQQDIQHACMQSIGSTPTFKPAGEDVIQGVPGVSGLPTVSHRDHVGRMIWTPGGHFILCYSAPCSRVTLLPTLSMD